MSRNGIIIEELPKRPRGAGRPVRVKIDESIDDVRKTYVEFERERKEGGEINATYNAGHVAGYDNGIAVAGTWAMPVIDFLSPDKKTWSRQERSQYQRLVRFFEKYTALHQGRLALIDKIDARAESREKKRKRDRRYRKRHGR